MGIRYMDRWFARFFPIVLLATESPFWTGDTYVYSADKTTGSVTRYLQPGAASLHRAHSHLAVAGSDPVDPEDYADFAQPGEPEQPWQGNFPKDGR